LQEPPVSNPEFRRPSFIPSVTYDDSRAALQWLQEAFGFEPSEVLTDADGNIVHAEMNHGDGVVMIGNEWADWTRSPQSVDGKNTQRVHVRIDRDIDAHCQRARRAGARIEMEPADQFYGDRTYMAVDPEGHHWTFAQPVKELSLKDMEDASGFKFQKLK
ncbi:MAG TPA: VOC family protein, partial [Candidatus Tumulicola sp.]|nr:VOC family protein [Candidatus Tumulicola sp.]